MSVVFIVLDRFTKFSYFFTILHAYTTCQIADVFFNGVFKLHGLPKPIVYKIEIQCLKAFFGENFSRSKVLS